MSMPGVYANNPTKQAEATAARRSRLEQKKAQILARLEILNREIAADQAIDENAKVA